MTPPPSHRRSSPDHPTESLVTTLSNRLDEPDWMAAFRHRCLSLYLNRNDTSSGWSADVPFRYDSVDAFLPPDEPANASPSASPSERIQRLRDRGVYFKPLRTALRDRPDLVRRHFMQHVIPPEQNPWSALHGALWNSGSFVYVPEDVHVNVPLTMYHRDGGTCRFTLPHQLIVVESGSSLRFLEGCSAPARTDTAVVLGCVEVFVRPDASVRYSNLQNWGSGAIHRTLQRSLVSKNGNMQWINGHIGAENIHATSTTVLNGSGASCSHLDASIASGVNSARTGATVLHQAPDTRSNITARSVSMNGGRVTFRCKLGADTDADGAVSRISSDGLMIGSGARTVTRNELDVRHQNVDFVENGTSGTLSAKKRHYLQTRGLPVDEARKTLLDGFLDPIVRALPTEFSVELQKQVHERLSV